jgi:hypothetical protein
MAYRLTDRTDKTLVKLDRNFAQQAIYHAMSAGTIDVETGDIVPGETEIPVKVRSAGLSSIDISQLQTAGLGQIDAAWWMRKAYRSEVKSGDVLSVSAFDYEIIDRGATLDALNLLWTIYTRRRR